MFTFEQIRCFVTIAEELHFGRAAERLQMTQPPLSRQIQKLERSLGVQLLKRDKRNVELTAAGLAFLVEARRLQILASSSLEQAQRIQAGAAGTVRMTFTAASTFGVLTTLLNLISESYPDIHIDCFEMVTKEQAAHLLKGDADLGLARPPFDRTAFASRLIHREELLFAVPEGHPLTMLERPVEPHELSGEPMIMYSPIEARYFYDLVVRVVGALPVTNENVVHTVSQVLTMVSLVARGRGVGFVPASAARLGIRGVKFLLLAGLPPEPVELHLLWVSENRNPAVSSIIDCVTRSTLVTN